MKSNNKAIALNMVANILSFGVSMVISFFLTPYITKNVGIEAYGLVGLANSFINYVNVITAALNSMASRFIIVELHKGNSKKANEYFSSALLANTVFAIIILIPAIWLISNLNILHISDFLLRDARITFSLVFANFIIGLIAAFYGIVLYAKNMIWKGAFRTLEANVLRVLLIVFLFSCFSGKIQYVVLAGLMTSFYAIGFNVFYTKKYLPELKIQKKSFRVQAILELVSSGIWNSVTKLSQILLDGLDLLLSNLFISGVMTGNVSIAKTIPSLYTTVVGLLSDSFYPEFLSLYSKNKTSELLVEIKKSINILSSISGICLSILIVYAQDFYMLWIPDSNADLLQKLTLLSVGTVLVSGCVYSLFSVFSMTNKVKINSIALLVTGLLSTCTTFLCLKTTNLGVYAIVGVSSCYGILRNLFFTPVYAAKCLNVGKLTFYPIIIKNLLNVVLLIIVDSVIRYYIVPKSWGFLVINGIIAAFVGGIVTMFVIFSKEQRNEVVKRFKERV